MRPSFGVRGPVATQDLLTELPPSTVYGSGFRRVMHGVRIGAEQPVDHGTLTLGYRRRSPRAVFTAHSAAWIWGARIASAAESVSAGFDGSLPRRRDEVTPHRLSPGTEVVLAGDYGRTASPAWTALDLARALNRPDSDERRSVAEVDAVLRWSSCTRAELLLLLDVVHRLDGLERARRVIELVRDGVDSPPESELRLIAVDAGLPAPVVQCPVRDRAGKVVARLDLGWPELRAGAEYDGLDHLDRDRQTVDIRRHNELRDLGWRVLQVNSPMMKGPRAALIGQLQRVVLGPAPGRLLS
ncbi:hypothetical protein [Aquipuribacter nitratireducens]|uniref:DUF559 domain-containing protein n=1 Tax=Aquipuribacter nitratireducens TaxID=650104 RepID=A0ABW0GKU2_9MICO